MVCIVYLQKRIAANITLEQGKTLVDAEGDVMRGLRKYYQLLHLIHSTYFIIYTLSVLYTKAFLSNNFPIFSYLHWKKI